MMTHEGHLMRMLSRACWGALGLAVGLSGCAIPSFRSDSFSYHVHLASVDERFPTLKAEETCFDRCAGRWVEYTFVHVDEKGLPNVTETITSQYGQHRYFGAGKGEMVRSFSDSPTLRVLDMREEDERGEFKQIVTFYSPRALGERHRLEAELPVRDCKALQPEDTSKDRNARRRQKLDFVAVAQERVYFFVDTSAVNPGCANLSPQDVLSGVSGLPPELVQRRYVVYAFDRQQEGDRAYVWLMRVRLIRPGGEPGGVCGAWRASWGGVSIACAGPVQTPTLSEDLGPEPMAGRVGAHHRCTEHRHAVDWSLYVGMSALSRGEDTVWRWCKELRGP